MLLLINSMIYGQNPKTDKGTSTIEKGKITISNPEVAYEVIIFDTGFENWLTKNARPRKYYDQTFLENHNRQWVATWNARATAGNRGYDYTIDYRNGIDYGYEVNYMLYNYLLYYQQTNGIKLN